MKLSEIRPCDNCGGQIVPIFYVVRTSIAVFNADATNQNLGLMRMLRDSLPLAEAFSSEPDAIKIGGEEDKQLWVDIILCQDCYVSDVNLALLAEKIANIQSRKDDSSTTCSLGGDMRG